MEISTFLIKSNFLKLFAYNFNKFKNYLEGKSGEKKQLEAIVVNNMPSSFLEDVVNNKKLIKLEGVVYCTKQDMSSLYGYPKRNILRWISIGKKNKVKAHTNTPICFVYHHMAHIKALESMKEMFGKAESYEPDKRVCPKCGHIRGCVHGGKKFLED